MMSRIFRFSKKLKKYRLSAFVRSVWKRATNYRLRIWWWRMLKTWEVLKKCGKWEKCGKSGKCKKYYFFVICLKKKSIWTVFFFTLFFLQLFFKKALFRLFWSFSACSTLGLLFDWWCIVCGKHQLPTDPTDSWPTVISVALFFSGQLGR